ncbi:hypothetical protein [Kitasatospora sp. NPDC057015]|uniref:hypothetical protein n=1 Tax=Kitasatospora sp. NPDC057015 TaxID=3346001 RepID=UPI00362BA7A1
MRYVFECLECGVHYLPPEGMAYSDGPASPVWCTLCQGLMCERGIPEPAAAAAVALAAAKANLAARIPPDEEARRPDVRPSRPAHTRRARSGPSSARSKLG